MAIQVSKKIRKGDKVVAIAGNNKGMSGTVLSCKGEKVLVQGLNQRKKHVRKQRNQAGQIITIERPIHISNLRVCTENNQPVKLHVQFNKEGERELVYKDGKKKTVYRNLKKAAK